MYLYAFAQLDCNNQLNPEVLIFFSCLSGTGWLHFYGSALPLLQTQAGEQLLSVTAKIERRRQELCNTS